MGSPEQASEVQTATCGQLATSSLGEVSDDSSRNLCAKVAPVLEAEE